MDHSEQAVHIFNRFAQQYHDKFMDVGQYKEGLTLFMDQLSNPKAKILDIACGPGNMAHYLLQHQPQYELLGIDLAPQMLELAKINNPQAQFQCMDIRNILQLKQTFDGIMAAFCLPYLNQQEAKDLIAHGAQLLNPQGVLYLSTMEDAYEQSRPIKGSSGDEIFIHFHQADYITEAMSQNGLTVLYTHRINNIMSGSVPINDLILIAQKST